MPENTHRAHMGTGWGFRFEQKEAGYVVYLQSFFTINKKINYKK